MGDVLRQLAEWGWSQMEFCVAQILWSNVAVKSSLDFRYFHGNMNAFLSLKEWWELLYVLPSFWLAVWQSFLRSELVFSTCTLQFQRKQLATSIARRRLLLMFCFSVVLFEFPPRVLAPYRLTLSIAENLRNHRRPGGGGMDQEEEK